ncbi:MAG: DUF1858 domain-containing protein [Nanoarchaeota archaeon]|nr:DUF1858 domain-containing protein [Nanoarchaeota archaeon]
MKLTKKSLIGNIVNQHPELAEIMFDYGMHCLGCAVSGFETIEQGCKAHNMDDSKIKEMLKKMNETFKKNESLKVSKTATEELLTTYQGKALRIGSDIKICEKAQENDIILKEGMITICIAKNKVKEVKGKRLNFRGGKFIIE